MKLADEDFPLHVEGKRIYSNRHSDAQIIMARDEELAADIVRRLNDSVAFADIPRRQLGPQ